MKNRGKLEDEVDELFKLPLADFIGERNTLAARLKQTGRPDDANLVKMLAKPSVSAWTVNQLYWNHRDAFDRLLAAGQRFHKAQTSSAAGKVADMRGSLDARREALADLAELATSVLSDAGHNPLLDTIRRITTTLEAVSAYASLSDGPTLGRLSQDVDPPGFESLTSFVTGTALKKTETPAKGASLQTSQTSATQKTATARAAREAEETRQVRIAAAKYSLQAARKSLADARTRAQTLESVQKKAHAESKQAEKQVREAEDRLQKARAASEAAAQRAQSIADDAEEAMKAVDEARRAMDKASKELESLFAEPARK